MDNVHYVQEGEWLVPAGETEFANDKTFGYRSSDLREYIEEKTGGTDKKEDVICISAQQLRSVDIDGVEQMLMNAGGFDKVVVNALTSLEIKVFCIALYRAMAKGKRFLFSTAAGFVKEFAAVEDREFLTGREPVSYTHLIQENGAGMGQLKETGLAAFLCAGKCPGNIAKKLAFQQGIGNGGAVDRHKGCLLYTSRCV